MRLIKVYVKLVSILLLVTVLTSFVIHSASLLEKEPFSLSTVDAVIITSNFLSGRMLYLLSPFTVAVVETIIKDSIFSGNCRVKNLVNDGFIVVGKVLNPKGKEEYHLRSYTSSFQPIDYTCPSCDFITISWIAEIKDGRIVSEKFNERNLASIHSYIYTRTALFVRKIINYF